MSPSSSYLELRQSRIGERQYKRIMEGGLVLRDFVDEQKRPHGLLGLKHNDDGTANDCFEALIMLDEIVKSFERELPTDVKLKILREGDLHQSACKKSIRLQLLRDCGLRLREATHTSQNSSISSKTL